MGEWKYGPTKKDLEKKRKSKSCKCGVSTVKEHVQAIMWGYPMHPYTGPK